MMRYQSMSQDCLLFPNNRRPNLKEEQDINTVTTTTATTMTATTNQSFKINKAPIFPTLDNRPPLLRPGPNPSAAQDRTFPPPPPSSPPSPPAHDVSGEAPLQWGLKKRSRWPRTEVRMVYDDPSAACRSTPAKAHRRPPLSGAQSKGVSLRSSTAVRDSSVYPIRNMDERCNGKRSPLHHGEKMPKIATRAGLEATNPPSTSEPSTALMTMERAELPKIQLSLSRKEKEEDFLLMRGTKLPQRPKKRPKIVEKSLQYVYPGMWLSDLSRGRYEVREKKCSKKKRRGLKGMESMDSDSY